MLQHDISIFISDKKGLINNNLFQGIIWQTLSVWSLNILPVISDSLTAN